MHRNYPSGGNEKAHSVEARFVHIFDAFSGYLTVTCLSFPIIHRRTPILRTGIFPALIHPGMFQSYPRAMDMQYMAMSPREV